MARAWTLWAALLLCTVASAVALDNGLGLKPVLGYNT